MKCIYRPKSCQLVFWTSICVIAIFSNVSSHPTIVSADELNPSVYSIDSEPYNITYGNWLAKSTQRMIQIPKEIHPAINYTSERCGTDQSGPVWFLTCIFDSGEERNCIIPSGKSILLPLLMGTCWDDINSPMKDQEIIQCARAGNEHGMISATIDGKEIKNLESYRTVSPFFNITVPENNIYDSMPGVWKAKTDGFFLFLEPLQPGNHSIHTTVSILNPMNNAYNYGADLTYHLVVPP
jgi:hypothetical protein